MSQNPDSEIQSLSHQLKDSQEKCKDLEDLVRKTESELQDFMETSKEMEAEMDNELSATNRKLDEFKKKFEEARGSVDEWKTKYQKLLSEHNSSLAAMDKELRGLRESHAIYKDKLRDMELDNDELENAERMVASSLVDMQSRYDRAVEKTALLEDELVEKSKLEEENQRLKDEVRDLNEECAVLKEQVQNLSSAQSRTQTPLESRSSNHSNLDDMTISDLLSKTSNSNPSQSTSNSRPSSSLSRERPLSATINPSSLSGTSTSGQNRRSNYRLADSLSHARRGSTDLRDFNLNGQGGGGNGNGGIPSSNSRERMLNFNNHNELSSPTVNSNSEKRRSLRRDAQSNNNQNNQNSTMVNGVNLTPGSRANAISRANSRAPISSVNAAAASSSQASGVLGARAKMKALTRKIEATRQNRKGGENSAIPRPSSRLGSSIGPSTSPTTNSTPNQNNLGKSVSRPRESFDGNKSISSIPLPSERIRRPNSRLSNVNSSGYIRNGRETPDFESRSQTPDLIRGNYDRLNHNRRDRMGSSSPSKKDEMTKEKFDRTVSPSFLNEEPPPTSTYTSKLPGLNSSITKRRSSVSSNSHHHPSSSSSASSSGATIAKDANHFNRSRGSTISNSSNLNSINSRINTENDIKDGPPSSWRVGSNPPVKVRNSSSQPR